MTNESLGLDRLYSSRRRLIDVVAKNKLAKRIIAMIAMLRGGVGWLSQTSEFLTRSVKIANVS